MGLLGGVFKAITQPITRITGKATPFLLPPITLTQTALNLTDKVLSGGLTPHGAHPTQTKAMIPIPQTPPRSLPYGQGSAYFQPQPYYGGGGFQPSFDFPPPQQPFYGGSPWDSSMTFQAYSPAPSPMYSAAPPTNRTWEDLISLAPVVASFL